VRKESKERSSSIDVLRGISIVLVVLWHTDTLFYGFIGVDFFFVISGYLVSKLLLKPFLSGTPISFKNFFVRRALKILPSYYAFLILGQGLAYLLYRKSHPDQIIPWADLPMYLFFYRNYRGNYHWSFDHLWSVCVEMHFYILLPLIFIIVQKHFKNGTASLLKIVILIIVFGLAAKVYSFYRFETYSGTQNRMDALGWGVLVALLEMCYCVRVKSQAVRLLLILVPTLAILLSNIFLYNAKSPFINEVVFHSLVPFAFSLILLGVKDWDVSQIKIFTPFRGFALVSYNWYLWHVIGITYMNDQWASGLLRTVAYFVISFVVAVLATVLIEVPFLKMRN
jgi:peptidoglycan/LPS O-acetylase OafA/YrhL